MVDIQKTQQIRKKEEKQLITARVPSKYLDALKKENVTTTSFIIQAFKETFPEL